MQWDACKLWYHGSPAKLTSLRIGSTITQDRKLASVFSHKPSLVIQDHDAAGKRIIKHNGHQVGYLYRVVTVIGPTDIEPHPTSTMAHGQEWLTRKVLDVELLEPTVIDTEEVLSAVEVEELFRLARHQQGESS